jgi:hypothetical protein
MNKKNLSKNVLDSGKIKLRQGRYKGRTKVIKLQGFESKQLIVDSKIARQAAKMSLHNVGRT